MVNVLVIRLSAIGDVAMTIPVVYSVAESNPEAVFTVLTQPFLSNLFIDPPGNVRLLTIDTQRTERSLLGLIRYAVNLSNRNYDVVLDLHDVIRTKILCAAFKWTKKPVYRIDKNRKERMQLIRRNDKVLKPLPSAFERYSQVFEKAGFTPGACFTSLFTDNEQQGADFIREKAAQRWIGIAPFAKHRGKIYPPEAMEEVVRMLSQKPDFRIFLFGSKGKEEGTLAAWESAYPNVKNIAGLHSLDKELALINHLDLLVSMDSANMHFASLTGTKVLSVWGATHPFAGFYGYRQNPDYVVQLDLPCRPCAVFGEKTCFRGDWACMTQITPRSIVNKVCEIVAEEKV